MSKINLQKSLRVFGNAEINGVITDINYEVGADGLKMVTTNSRFSTDGLNANLTRNYNPDGSYFPVQQVKVYPFDAAFDTALASIVTQIYADPSNPENVTV